MVQGPPHRFHGDLVRWAVLPAKALNLSRSSRRSAKSPAIHADGETALRDDDDWRRHYGPVRSAVTHHKSGAAGDRLVSAQTIFSGHDGDLSLALLGVDCLAGIHIDHSEQQISTLVQRITSSFSARHRNTGGPQAILRILADILLRPLRGHAK